MSVRSGWLYQVFEESFKQVLFMQTWMQLNAIYSLEDSLVEQSNVHRGTLVVRITPSRLLVPRW